MYPLVTAAIGLVQGNKRDRDARRQVYEEQEHAKRRLYESLLTSRAAEMGADTREIRAVQGLQDIERGRAPTRQAFDNIDISQVLGMVGNAIGKTEPVDERIAKEAARRGLMNGWEPF